MDQVEKVVYLIKKGGIIQLDFVTAILNSVLFVYEL